MSETKFNKIRVARRGGVATVTIDNPPVNVLDAELMKEIRSFLFSARDDAQLRVIVFDSADPEFFVAHVDMTIGDQPSALDELTRSAPKGLSPFQAFSEELRNATQVTIVKLAGLARGGGAEFVAAADMAFAAEEKAGLAHCEALMGITPGGGGTQYLDTRMTRGRTLEVILGADLFDAKTAERYGWINRALPADQLDAFVDTLACNIAALADGVIAAAKRAIPPKDLSKGFGREFEAWSSLVQRPAAQTLMRAGLAAGAQTGDGERDLEALLRPLQDKAHKHRSPRTG